VASTRGELAMITNGGKWKRDVRDIRSEYVPTSVERL